jgi:hypothetical protein
MSALCPTPPCRTPCRLTPTLSLGRRRGLCRPRQPRNRAMRRATARNQRRASALRLRSSNRRHTGRRRATLQRAATLQVLHDVTFFAVLASLLFPQLPLTCPQPRPELSPICTGRLSQEDSNHLRAVILYSGRPTLQADVWRANRLWSPGKWRAVRVHGRAVRVHHWAVRVRHGAVWVRRGADGPASGGSTAATIWRRAAVCSRWPGRLRTERLRCVACPRCST